MESLSNSQIKCGKFLEILEQHGRPLLILLTTLMSCSVGSAHPVVRLCLWLGLGSRNRVYQKILPSVPKYGTLELNYIFN